MDKEVRKKKLQVKLEEIQATIGLLWFLLILEGLILLILNPYFIPVDWLSRVLEVVQAFFLRILWPVGEGDFVDRTYRYYIYVAITWLRNLQAYPIVTLVLRYGLPVLQCALYVYRALVSVCLTIVGRERPQKRSGQAKKNTQPKQPKEPRGALVSGMLEAKAKEANRYLQELQNRHPALPKGDMGVWIGNQSAADGSKAEEDRILPWQNGRIVYDMGTRGKLVFKLEGAQAYLETEKGSVTLTVGEPLAICHVSAAKEETVVATATWLGGF